MYWSIIPGLMVKAPRDQIQCVGLSQSITVIPFSLTATYLFKWLDDDFKFAIDLQHNASSEWHRKKDDYLSCVLSWVVLNFALMGGKNEWKMLKSGELKGFRKSLGGFLWHIMKSFMDSISLRFHLSYIPVFTL